MWRLFGECGGRFIAAYVYNTPHSLTLHNPKNSLTILECQDSKQDSSTQNERDNEQLKDSLKAGANLLIKGNNLLALHSLKKKFANKVKLIYIDPPYNTGNDSFNYNDNFNHSTWLTFMKNRLEIAKEFLRDDGVIFIQCDDNEQAYLKVLCDEIFGRDNFVATICWEKKGGRQNDAKFYSVNHEYILNYAKKKECFKPNLLERTLEMLQQYKNPDNDPRGVWTSITLQAKSGTDSMRYRIKFDNGVEWEAPTGTYPRFSKENLEKLYKENRLWFGESGKNTPRLKKFLSEIKEGVIHNTLLTQDEVGNTQKAKQEIKVLFENDNTTLFATPKPEALIKRIIEISTQENDLVMDFFAGSGTTLAVAHKMKRRFIGIEQMDYIESITKERLKKVVAGEQGGISKALNWQGGGSFIYAELMPLNVIYKERIKNINDEKMLDSIYKDLESKAFLDYRIDLDSILKDKEFKELDLQEKKEVLLDILDSNMDYVLYGDIQDEDYAISSEVIELNKIFYGDCHDFANAKSRNDKKGK
ncbi:site-specific DNA-methyltransferase [Campylobacter upsaliensis]